MTAPAIPMTQRLDEIVAEIDILRPQYEAAALAALSDPSQDLTRATLRLQIRGLEDERSDLMAAHAAADRQSFVQKRAVDLATRRAALSTTEHQGAVIEHLAGEIDDAVSMLRRLLSDALAANSAIRAAVFPLARGHNLETALIAGLGIAEPMRRLDTALREVSQGPTGYAEGVAATRPHARSLVVRALNLEDDT